MDPEADTPRTKCVSCGAALFTDSCARCGRPRELPIDYLSKMEDLARKIVGAAVQEDSFDVFSGNDTGKTSLQKAISRAAAQLRFWHYPGDGCLGHGPTLDAE